MNEVAYFNLLRGNTLRSYTRIDKEFIDKGRYGKDYSFIEFGIDKARKGNRFCNKGEAGEVITLTADCGKIHPYKYKTKVSVNPALYEWGLVSTPDLYEEGYYGPIEIKLLLTKDLDLKEVDLDFLVRVYVTT